MLRTSLFTPVTLGSITLPNRIIMAPLTRMRAHPSTHAPTDIQAAYYAQRATAGLIISEATAISPTGFGWAKTPGLWSPEQVESWTKITNAVHEAGGRIFAQLWHTGAMSHPELLGGGIPLAPSAINPEQRSVLAAGRVSTVTPQEMEIHQIGAVIRDFELAASNAMRAGFDGVQILANYLYLIAQFLHSATNKRNDLYGGSIENRSRFLFEVLESVLKVVPADMVGIKLSPMHESGPFRANDDTLPTVESVMRRLNEYKLSHLMLMGNSTDFTGSPIAHLSDDQMFHHFRDVFNGPIIASVNFTSKRAEELLSRNVIDAVAFGRDYIANPDLVERLRLGRDLSQIDWNTVYGDGPEGYTDYPTYGASCPWPA